MPFSFPLQPHALRIPSSTISTLYSSFTAKASVRHQVNPNSRIYFVNITILHVTLTFLSFFFKMNIFGGDAAEFFRTRPQIFRTRLQIFRTRPQIFRTRLLNFQTRLLNFQTRLQNYPFWLTFPGRNLERKM